MRTGALVGGAATIALIGGIVLLPAILPDDSAGSACAPAAGVSAANGVSGDVAGYSGVQLENAAAIIDAGADMGLSLRDQTIAVMTAMGESSLQVLDYGDLAGPDSRGLFQQRDSWGTLEQRMDPHESATLFYERIAGVADRDVLQPTIVAHRVQRNANPNHYAPFYDPATQVVAALTGGEQPAACGPGLPGEVIGGYAIPADGEITSSYGPRDVIDTPAGPTFPFHYGTDITAACDSPVWASAGGTVTGVSEDQFGGWIITVAHTTELVTRYVHPEQEDIYVGVGDAVEAGEQIAGVGTSGLSTGCHLHFEVLIDGDNVNPVLWMRAVGLPA